MALDPMIATAMEIGRRKAGEAMARRQAARARREAALDAHPKRAAFDAHVATAGGPAAAASRRTAGFIVALGDSWFDYPLHDVVKLLNDGFGYNVESAARRGDRIEAMAYEGGQIDQFTRCLEKVIDQGALPKAILLSGGGDDIAGDEFGMLLNSRVSSVHGLNADVVDGVVNQRIRTAFYSIISSINSICVGTVNRTLPIIVHGYDYPVPDGRGVLGGWPFPGPWLEPGFREKGFDDLAATTAMMRDLIDHFNQMLATIAADVAFSNVHVLDLRGTLSSDLADSGYELSWANELHPTKEGFEAITAKFAEALSPL